MKHLVWFTVLTICVAIAYGEVCTYDDDCVTTMCVAGSNVLCQHRDGVDFHVGGGLCTCATTNCVTRDDCQSPNHPELICDDSKRHCYDGLCICTRW